MYLFFPFSSSDTTMMLEDNYSSEEELKEIISSEKQRKRSGGGSVKDGKSQHRGATRDSQYNEHPGERRKSSVKRGSLGAETMVTCQSISDSLSPSPSSGKMALPGSRPSSARTCKVARATPSGASSNAAGKYYIIDEAIHIHVLRSNHISYVIITSHFRKT